MSLGVVFHDTDGKGVFVAMSREIVLRIITDKERRDGVYGENDFDDDGERLAESQ